MSHAHKGQWEYVVVSLRRGGSTVKHCFLGRICIYGSFFSSKLAEMTACICVSPNQAQVLLDYKISTIQHIVVINSDKKALKRLRDSSAGRVQIHKYDDILVRPVNRILCLTESSLLPKHSTTGFWDI